MNRKNFIAGKILAALVLFMLSNFSSCDKDVTVSAPPEPVPQGFLYVNTSPGGSTIYVNGKNTGRVTPDSLPYMEGGTYQITLKRKYFRDTTFTAEIPDNDKKTITVDYYSNPLMYGKLFFQSSPAGSQIFLNDSSINAVTPYTLNNVFPGEYKVSFKKPNFRDGNIITNAESNKQVSVSLTLRDTSIWVDYRTINSSIPTDFLNSVTIDSRGIKWIGSSTDGLIRFDGAAFSNYNESNSDIPLNIVNYVAVDNRDRVWVCTNNGLGIFDGVSWKVYNILNSALPVNNINVVKFDESGTAWIGTTSKLVKFDGVNWEVISYAVGGYEYLWVNDLVFENDYIWIATNNYGVVRYDRNNNFKVYNKENVSGFLSNLVSSIDIEENGTKWFAISPSTEKGDSGVINYPGGFAYLAGESVTSTMVGTSTFLTRRIFVDRNSKKWISTNEGIIRIVGSGGYSIISQSSQGLTSNNVTQIVQDRDGSFWITATGGGLNKYKGDN